MPYFPSLRIQTWLVPEQPNTSVKAESLSASKSPSASTMNQGCPASPAKVIPPPGDGRPETPPVLSAITEYPKRTGPTGWTLSAAQGLVVPHCVLNGPGVVAG